MSSVLSVVSSVVVLVVVDVVVVGGAWRPALGARSALGAGSALDVWGSAPGAPVGRIFHSPKPARVSVSVLVVWVRSQVLFRPFLLSKVSR